MIFIESLNSTQIKIFTTFGITILYHLFYIALIVFFAKIKEVNGTYTYSSKFILVNIYKVYLSIRIISWNIIGFGVGFIWPLEVSKQLLGFTKIGGWVIFGWIMLIILLCVFLITLYELNQKYFSKDFKFITKKNNNTLIVSENFVKINAQDEINLEKYCLYFKNNRELNSFKTHLEGLGLHLFRFHLYQIFLKNLDKLLKRR
jgi:hypothetical protein